MVRKHPSKGRPACRRDIVAGGSLLLSLPCAMSSADLAHHDPVDLMPAEEVAARGTVHDLSFFHRIIGAPR